MRTNLTFDDLLRLPAGRRAGKDGLCRILDAHGRAKRFLVKGCPNARQIMTSSGWLDGPHITLPYEETFTYRYHSAHGGCLVRAEALEAGSSIDDVEKIIIRCRNSRELTQADGQLWLLDYTNVPVITSLLFPGEMIGPLLSESEPVHTPELQKEEALETAAPNPPPPSIEDIKAIVHKLVAQNSSYMAQRPGAQKVREMFPELVRKGCPFLHMADLMALFAEANGTTVRGPKRPRSNSTIRRTIK